MLKNKRVFIGAIVLIIFIIIGLAFRMQSPTPPQAKNLPMVEKEIAIDENNLKTHIKKLSGEEFGGRRAGTSEEAEVILYLAQELKKYHIKPLGNKNTYFQTFSLPFMDLRKNGARVEFYLKDNNKTQLVADNVLGLIESEVNKREYILISAHLDHLGIWREQLYPGANDNASGVGAVLEMGRVLQSLSKGLPYSIIIAFWSGEEMGLIGSNYFSNNPLVALSQIKLAINLDSIGKGTNNDFILWGSNSEKILRNLFDKLNQLENLEITWEDSQDHTSDHKALASKGIPAATILAKNWLEDNHTPQDTYSSLNYEKIRVLAQEIINLLSSSQIIDIIKAQ